MPRPPRSATPAADAPTPAKPSTVQMADIARLANVSISTVSRALSNHPRLSAETRNRITELAKSLNFSVNTGAQIMRGKQPQTVAVAFPYHPEERQHFKDPFFLATIGSIGDALLDSGHRMLIVGVEASRIETLTEPYETKQAVGTIILGQETHHALLNELAVRQLPFVVWGARLTDQLYCTVGTDNVAGGLAATQHLLACGARRIAFLGDRRLAEAGQRHQGYCDAHRALGLEPDARLELPVPFSVPGARLAIERLLQEGTRFDAVFACSDLMAITVISTLRSRGLEVPRDVQVVGFDDISLAADVHPPLTTVRQPIEAAGKELVRLLLARLQGKAIVPVVMAPALIVRESTRRAGP